MERPERIAILGGGNIGTAIAYGLVGSGRFRREQIIVTRRKIEMLRRLADEGFVVLSDNVEAVRRADIVVLSVLPQQVVGLLRRIKDALSPKRHVIMSVVTGVSVSEIRKQIGGDIPVVRVIPNTAIAICESMTLLAADEDSEAALATAKEIFDRVGATLSIDEEQAIPGTALGACGVAFFLRAIRAASQGGIEVGFHPSEALKIAAQTAKGAAALLMSAEDHPESEIDRVTTPRGCTIAGLNQMEHQGFSSAMIQGITTAAEKAALLYTGDDAKR